MRGVGWVLAVVLGLGSIGAVSAQEQPVVDKFQAAIKGAKRVEGLWTIHYKEQQVLVELKANQLQQDFLMLSSLARGISQGHVLSGMSWGDDVLWSFRKVGDKVHLLKKNVRFKAKPGTPEAAAVQLAYSDAVMYALPVVAESGGSTLIDMTRVFFSDDEKVGRTFGGSFVFDRSTVNKIKGFPRNMEITINAVYSTPVEFDTVTDSRGVQLGVHYSISQLPGSGYKPRKADDRVGYFLTAAKDFSDNSDEFHFQRYITRWDLQKADPNAKLSPPKEPIIFHMERTIPINLRPTVRAGIEEWNKAFEKVGYANAIEVRQQRDDDEWDPEDVRYNTFRWITAEAGFAIGPSRVNPLTGQILDADILFDASFLRAWGRDYDLFATQPGETPKGIAKEFALPNRDKDALCFLSSGMHEQMGFAAAAIFAGNAEAAKKGELPEEYVHQALKEVVMHEVGHTLGLRHNFKASTWKSLAEIEDANKAGEPTVASVMDYCPVSIALPGQKQGAYYTTTIGPYDYWAIEYGYKQVSGDEATELKKIASRAAEPGLDYSTDEDTRPSDPDPYSNRFDMGNDINAFARRQAKFTNELLPKLVEKIAVDGDGYQKVRLAYSYLMRRYWDTIDFAARLPGGVMLARDHKGDPNARPPFRVVAPAQQRDAMKLIGELAYTVPSLPPDLVNYLATNKWSHWGMTEPFRQDPALHSMVLERQANLIQDVFSPLTISRIQDNETKAKAEEDAYTIAEHLDLAVTPAFTELSEPAAGEYSARKPLVDSYRRNLQRLIVTQLGNMVIRDTGVPADARVLARAHLETIKGKLLALPLKEGVKLDPYTAAHVADLKIKIEQIEKQQLITQSVN